MGTIVVFEGTGYTGGNIVREAASRGHHVIAVSRSEPAEPIEGVTYETGAAEALAPRLISGADVVVAALSPRGDMTGRLVGIYRELAGLCAEAGTRYLQIGGFSSLRPAPDAPRLRRGRDPRAVPRRGARG
jgi:putative NADH-flavin reductase